MDYEEEQQMEMEALESILGEDNLRKYTGPTPSGWSTDRNIHAINLAPESTDGPDCSCDLIFQHTETYPEDLPLFKLSNTRGLNNNDIDCLTAVLKASADENLGMASVFAIMQAAQEWLESRVGIQQEEDPALVKQRKDAEEERRLQESRAQGTPVTPESFALWKATFEEEQASLKGPDYAQVDEEAKAKRKTGKEFFMEKYEGTAGGPVEDEFDVDDLDDDVLLDDAIEEELLETDSEEDDEQFLDQYLAENDSSD